ncbi:hypothetical protein QP028_15080 [Corynebacterium suedekumii]|nr:hypothetical protein QP028_15080 [Corynebacterium suedekumii]
MAAALASGGVVSLGGGAVLTDAAAAAHPARRRGGSTSPSRRSAVPRGDLRPVLAAEDPAAHYRNLIEQRSPLYHEVAGFRVHTDGRTPRRLSPTSWATSTRSRKDTAP